MGSPFLWDVVFRLARDPVRNSNEFDYTVSRSRTADARFVRGGRESVESGPVGVDARLVQSALAGDPAAFRELYERHNAHVAGLVWRLVRRTTWVEDIVQETFISAFSSLDRLREPQKIRGWLGVIASRTVGRRLDRERRRRGMLELLHLSAQDRVVEPGGDAASLFALLDRLPSRLRTPWILARIEGEPLARVAALSECSLATAKRRIASAQEELEGWYER